MMNRFLLSLCCCLPLLSACASDEHEKPVPERHCPQVAILRSVEKIEDYGSDAIDPANLVAVGQMTQVEGACAYDDKGVDVTFELKMEAQKGARLGGETVSFPFFVSVLKSDDSVLGKELITASFTFADGAKTATSAQPLHVFLPLAKDEDASGFRVLLGFQLTEDQLKALR